MDRQTASEALAEVRGRQEQVSAIVWRQGVPVLLVGGVAALLLVSPVAHDVRTQVPGWNGLFLTWVVPALAVLAIVAVVLVVMHRRLGLRPQGPAARAYLVLIWLVVAYYVLSVAIGIPLRENDVLWDHTLSAVPAMAVVLVVAMVWRAVVIRRADGHR